jgi:hypothetical protein
MKKFLTVRFFFAAFGISVTMLLGRNPIATNEHRYLSGYLSSYSS